MSKVIKKSQPMGTLRSLIESNVNEENRTVELVFTTGSKGLRNDWDIGPYYEELSMDKSHIDMSRLTSGSAPLLASHNSYDLNAVIGVVERAWVEGNEGKAVVRFSSDLDAEKIYRKVKEKVLRNVSIGYQVRKYQDVSKPGDKIPTLRAVDYSIHEISIVPIGFDKEAQIRSQEIQNEVEIETQESEVNQINEPSQDSNSVEAHAVDANEKERTMTEAEKLALEQAAKKQAAQEEKQRQNEIRTAVRGAKLEESYADELISQDFTADQARKLVIEKLASSQPAPISPVTTTVEVSGENSEKRREAFESALLHRMNKKNPISGEAKILFGKNLLRQIESIVPRNTMESDSQYAKRAMSSSDLPLALANVAEKELQNQYALQPRTFEQWSRQDTLRNYKEMSQVKSGDYASLIERPEGAEFQIGSFGEENEVVQLKDYGIIHAFTSQMLVNDDLGVLSRMAQSGGIAASRLENRLAYSALSTNKTMKDGVALYHATHANLGTAAAISLTSVAEAYKLMRKQKSVDSADSLNLAPKYFVCGPDKETEARQFFAAVNAQQTSNVNIFSGSMQVIVDNELTGNQYYFLADQNLIDTIVCYRLEGQEQPSIESRMKWETNSLELKIAHAFAAAPMDWRGIVKNAGA